MKMNKNICLGCGGTGRHPGLVEAEPGSGRKFVSTTAECRKCKRGLKLRVKRLEAYCAGVHAEPPEDAPGGLSAQTRRDFREAMRLVAAAVEEAKQSSGGAR